MIIFVEGPDAAMEIRRVLAREVMRQGDEAPEEFRTPEIFIRRQLSSSVVTSVDTGAAVLDHDQPMTRAQAARAIGCSPSTVDRLARAGEIVKIRGGRLTAESIRRYQRGDHR